MAVEAPKRSWAVPEDEGYVHPVKRLCLRAEAECPAPAAAPAALAGRASVVRGKPGYAGRAFLRPGARSWRGGRRATWQQ